MDGEEFFDRLYSRFHIHFPCYAVYRKSGYLTREAAGHTAALVLLSDEDLADQVLRSAGRRSAPALVRIEDADHLARLVSRLPERVTHVTFDPSPRFHRRFPVGVIRDCLAEATDRAA